MAYCKIKNTGFNIEEFSKMSKTQFKKWYKLKKRNFNLEETWTILQKAIKEYKSK